MSAPSSSENTRASIRQLHRSLRFYRECLEEAAERLVQLQGGTTEQWMTVIKATVEARIEAENREERGEPSP